MSRLSISLFILILAISALAPASNAAVSGLEAPVGNHGTAIGSLDIYPYHVYLPVILKDYSSIEATSQATSTNEDTPKTITLTGKAGSGGSLAFSVISNPSHGSLGSLGTVSCTGSPSTCTVDVLYTPAPDYNGPDSFTFKVNDGKSDSNIATVDITVNPVNDAPSFTKGANQVINEDAGAQSVPGWATGISAGPNEGTQTVSFIIDSNDNPSLFSAGPAVASNGTLTYTPAANQNGVATITLHIQDNGGTANGGVDSSAAQSFTITVNPVNDAPSFTKGANQAVNEDAGAQSVPGWATGISAGPNEGTQTVSFIIDSNDNPSLFSAGPAVASNGTLSYTPAANQNGVATITLHIQDNGGIANGGVNSSAAQSFTITVNPVNDAPVAQTKTASAQANMKVVGLNANLTTGVTDVDSGVNGCAPTFTVASITAGSGGTVSAVNLAAGTFDFDPNPGFTGTAVVNYTVNDNGCPGTLTSAPAAINITVSGPVIWFVNPAVLGPGDGRLSNPFKYLSGNLGSANDADDVDASGHKIFVYAGTVTNGIVLNSTEWLVGQGVSGTTFDALFGITPPAGTLARPAIATGTATIQGTVTLATNVVVKGIAVSPTGATQGMLGSGGITGVDVSQTSLSSVTGTALSLNNVSGSLTFSSVSVTGNPAGATGIDLTNTSASVTISGGNLQNTTATGVSINGGTGAFSLSFTSLSNTAGRTILVQNRSSGTITFGGTISAGGTGISVTTNTGGTVNFTAAITGSGGISLNNNTGAAINFTSGSVQLSTGANSAFVATGGGTVTVTGSNNTLTTLGGTSNVALNVSNTTIGAGGLTFKTISASGGANGIVLNNTGSSGSLTVTGTGGTCTAADTSGCTGGVIQNMTGADDASATPVGTGIVLNSTMGVSLTRMWIHDHSNYAIRATSLNGFTLGNSVINGTNGGPTAASAGSPYNDSSFYFTNLTGSASISNTSISGGFSNNVKLVNTTGTLDRLTFSSVTIGANSTTDGNDGIGIEGQGAAVVKVTVQNSTFTSARGDLFQMNHIGTGTADLIFSGNALSNNHPAIATGGGGVTLGNGSSSTFSMSLTSNTFRDAVGHAILIVKDIGTGTQLVTFNNNTVGVSGVANSGSKEGSDLKIQQAGDGTQTVLVSGNIFYQYNNDAVLLQTGAGIAKGGSFNATVTGNTISNAGNNAAIAVPVQGISLNGGVTPGDSFAICAQIGGASTLKNDLDSAIGPYGGGDYRLRQRQNTTVRLPGYAGGAADTAAVVVFVNGNNIVSGSGTATVSGTGGGFVGGAACPVP